jgi:methyltransferase (TIGR00027 family)
MDAKEEPLINHISDTALWIAAYRAQETSRKDAVFHDPLAKKLAGPRGFEMVAITPNTEMMAFAMVVRTVALDRLIQMALAKGVDTVINLGAGLDTRPYRMKLPEDLPWIEVDFPHLIEYKTSILKDEKPVCHLQRIAVDLSDEIARKDLFDTLGTKTKKALIITEGVVGYLTSAQATSLAESIYAVDPFQYWIMDYSQGEYSRKSFQRKLNKQLAKTPLQFNEKYPLQFFGKLGWHVEEDLHILDEGDRIGRKMPLRFPATLMIRFFREKIRKAGNEAYGFALLKKAEHK